MAAAGKCCSRRLLGQQVAEALRRQGRRRREDAGVNGVRLRVPGHLRSFGGESLGLRSLAPCETKITKDEWLAKLKEVRAANKILASDECAWITGGASGTTCSEHFGFDV